MNDLLAPDLVPKLVGVIDLRHGQAVHAIAGNRECYRSVELCGGDPVLLADHYQKLGVTDRYVADLDAIVDGEIQFPSIEAVCSRGTEGRTLIDIGWNASIDHASRNAISALTTRCPGLDWIAASESLQNVSDFVEICELVTPSRVFLGLDYRNDRLLGNARESEWIEAATELGCRGAVLLDLASVGTGSGPRTVATCRRVKRLAPRLSLVSGGGIRAARDAHELIEAGCDRCLVATALQDGSYCPD